MWIPNLVSAVHSALSPTQLWAMPFTDLSFNLHSMYIMGNMHYPTPQVCTFDNQCEWGNCRQRYSTPKNLLSHIEEEHLVRLPYRLSGQGRTQHEFICLWTSCAKVFSARYKLLLHVQTAHCKEKLQRSNVSCEGVYYSSSTAQDDCMFRVYSLP